ncbi:MAG: UDP-N-acetylglucosamine diphosphorylase/glucosamine-1-phosphate N-acetyltransferase [Deltaproteobacteria bacterium RIFCSPHIGHO2_02_FULL_44_16]|nr:MAG: UDP-N-acetylglucosamine diphosphorylase/glucosamine-1-phosphate N-acetyltransferase [Deltaproteobacteria bacterium RIFCSPHIGHO2_02_FULL_44_16]
MKSALPKVLHPLAGRPILSYPLEISKKMRAAPCYVLIPPAKKLFEPLLAQFGAHGIIQQKPLGTAHAVLATRSVLSSFQGHVLILCGDVPLLRFETVRDFVSRVVKEKMTLGVITMRMEVPEAYGRVVRDLDAKVVGIVEAKEATEDQRKITEVNTGVYCVEKEWLFKVLQHIRPSKGGGEYYLTDIVSHAVSEGESLLGYEASDSSEFLGVNSRSDLAHVARLMRHRLNQSYMREGVGMIDETSVYIDDGVQIGEDTLLHPGVCLRGKTKVGRRCILEPGVILTDMMVADDVQVKAYSILDGSRVAEGAVIGPFARIRPESDIGKEVKIGNFVEVKKTTLKRGAKANHLSYLGDSIIGAEANIGCGTITCNYDGHSKHQTIIGEKAFIGSDVQFVAPVKVGRDAVVGAGSTITKNVPAHSLSLARSQQVVIKGWKPKWKRKK